MQLLLHQVQALHCYVIAILAYSVNRRVVVASVSARCLKITEKVSFNIASYAYILNGQKLIKNAKNGAFWRVFENLKLAVKQFYQTGQFQ